MRILIVIGFICGVSSLHIAQQARPHWMEEEAKADARAEEINIANGY